MMKLIILLKNFSGNRGTFRTASRAGVFAFLFLSTFFPQAGNAQSEGKIYGGLGYFALGYTRLDLAPMNERLQRESFAGAPMEYFTFGGAGHVIIGSVIIGGEGHSMSAKSAVTDRVGPVESTLDGGYGFFNLGYVLIAKKGLLIYPMLGIGSGNMRLNLSDAPQATSFQAVLLNHNRSVDIQTRGFLFNFQLGMDYMLSGKDERRGGLLLGLHGGYIYSPTQWDWKWQGATLTDGPNVNLSGPYVRLTIGGGGYTRQKLR